MLPAVLVIGSIELPQSPVVRLVGLVLLLVVIELSGKSMS
jgi:hypothetical protein